MNVFSHAELLADWSGSNATGQLKLLCLHYMTLDSQAGPSTVALYSPANVHENVIYNSNIICHIFLYFSTYLTNWWLMKQTSPVKKSGREKSSGNYMWLPPGGSGGHLLKPQTGDITRTEDSNQTNQIWLVFVWCTKRGKTGLSITLYVELSRLNKKLSRWFFFRKKVK